MANPTKSDSTDTDPTKLVALTDPFSTSIWAIISADRGVNSTNGALAFQAASLPPSGNVTLETLSTTKTEGNAAGAPAAGYNALLTPPQLWVTVATAPGGPYHIIAYTSYSEATQSGLTAAAAGAPVTVAPIDSGTTGQLWNLTKSPLQLTSPPKQPTVELYYIENAQVIGAIKRSSSYPVPGVGIELGLAPDQDKHKVPFSYEMLRVPQPQA